jgi:DNA-binding transcriptional LysR family regulator
MSGPRRNLPSLNALRAFEVAGRKLNFRMATDALFVSQSAVAQQVRAFEETLPGSTRQL